MRNGRLGTLVLAFLMAGCGPAARTVSLDGSATVFPIANALAEEFGRANPELAVLANKCGTGGGLGRLGRGEIDVATASRRISPEEAKAVPGGVVEIPLAFDGVTVVVNPA